MASACVNHIQPTTQYSSTTTTNYTTNWFTNQQSNASASSTSSSPNMNGADFGQESSTSDKNNNASDFNFQLSSNTVAILPADELFSDGKLLPLHFSTPKQSTNATLFSDANKPPTLDLENLKENPNFFSPKAPRCSSKLKELIRFKSNTKSIKQLLYKNISKTTSSSSNTDASSSSSSLNSPLLKHSSVSSSDTDHPRHSLEKPNSQPAKPAGPKLRPVRAKQAQTAPPPQQPMMESPRMGPSGRVVFEGLARSTSCPSSFNGGKTKGCYYYNGKTKLIERSYSVANVNNNRVTPVLNVPVCSIRGSSKLMGFSQLFYSSSSHKKDGVTYYCKSNNNHSYVNGSKNKKEKEKPKEGS